MSKAWDKNSKKATISPGNVKLIDKVRAVLEVPTSRQTVMNTFLEVGLLSFLKKKAK